MIASSPNATATAAERLLAWYEGARRELPWRASRDPYRVWLSEVMLQQTRVETVVPYYRRFLAAFPDVAALAAAPEDAVLAAWSGLGYYRRARQLHAAARAVAAAGGFPGDAAGWRALPGVGDYTAAAVASIAYGEPVPVLDGNVERVMARLLARDGDPRRAAQRRELRAAAAALLVAGRAGDSNQALMELGATVCRPRAPRCGACPLAADCRGRESGRPEDFPAPRARRAVERLRLVMAVAERDGRVLLFRRPEGSSLLGGTWELPWCEEPPMAADGSEPSAASAELERRYGGRWRLGVRCGAVRHGITHRALEVAIHAAEVAAADAVAAGPEARWVGEEGLGGLPLSSLVTKALARYREAARAPALPFAP